MLVKNCNTIRVLSIHVTCMHDVFVPIVNMLLQDILRVGSAHCSICSSAAASWINYPRVSCTSIWRSGLPLIVAFEKGNLY